MPHAKYVSRLTGLGDDRLTFAIYDPRYNGKEPIGFIVLTEAYDTSTDRIVIGEVHKKGQ